MYTNSDVTSCASSGERRSRKLKPRGWSRSARRRTWTRDAAEAGSRARMSVVRSPWGSMTVAPIGDSARARTRLSRSVLLPEPVEPKTAR